MVLITCFYERKLHDKRLRQEVTILVYRSAINHRTIYYSTICLSIIRYRVYHAHNSLTAHSLNTDALICHIQWKNNPSFSFRRDLVSYNIVVIIFNRYLGHFFLVSAFSPNVSPRKWRWMRWIASRGASLRSNVRHLNFICIFDGYVIFCH